MSRSSFSPHSDAAYGPGAPALSGPSDLGDRKLLFAGCQVCARRVPQSPMAFPSILVKLHAAVEPVAGVDRPVTAGLTGGQRVPCAAVVHRRHSGARLGADA